jgi:hypothetical protein
MADLKKCDRCGQTADIVNEHPMHGHSPNDWAHIAVTVQCAVQMPRMPSMHSLMELYSGVPHTLGDDDIADGASEPQMTDRPFAVQSNIDLCPTCVDDFVKATGCADKIKTKPAFCNDDVVNGKTVRRPSNRAH